MPEMTWTTTNSALPANWLSMESAWIEVARPRVWLPPGHVTSWQRGIWATTPSRFSPYAQTQSQEA